jgi:hypothetical protein
MPMAPSYASGWRIVRRKCVCSTAEAPRHTLRPSWTNLALHGDVWLVPRGADQLDLMFDHIRVARIRGTTLDIMSMNQMAFGLRHRRPRQISCAPRAARERRTNRAG